MIQDFQLFFYSNDNDDSGKVATFMILMNIW